MEGCLKYDSHAEVPHGLLYFAFELEDLRAFVSRSSRQARVVLLRPKSAREGATARAWRPRDRAMVLRCCVSPIDRRGGGACGAAAARRGTVKQAPPMHRVAQGHFDFVDGPARMFVAE